MRCFEFTYYLLPSLLSLFEPIHGLHRPTGLAAQISTWRKQIIVVVGGGGGECVTAPIVSQMANCEAIDQTASQHIILQFADF